MTDKPPNICIGAPESAVKFGTFLGVFTPSMLTILGLIMYLRFAWVVSSVGLGGALIIVLLSSTITFITALSASALATNMHVGVGGPYYLISRSLGLELGGAIGIPLFLCRTLSITFYSFGLSEAILDFWPARPPEFLHSLLSAEIIARWPAQQPELALPLMTGGIILFITAISGKSAAISLKMQIPIMVAVGLSIIALTIGTFTAELQAPQWWTPAEQSVPEAEGFWYVFAVFFPAVTGWAVGIGMSGDLKDPRRSIPRGTIAAVLTSTVVYLIVPVLLAITTKVNPELLQDQRHIVWLDIAWLGGWLVLPGLWGAILSSALGSVLGGPRVLQALANDGLAPRFTAKLSKTGQPTVATWISGAIALAAVGLGSLDAVAQFVTILFLTLYVTVNLSAALEKIVGDPSYRPTINVPVFVSLLGAASTIWVMFLIAPMAGAAAITLELLLYLYLRRRAMKQSWGDVRGGLWATLTRFGLLMLRRHREDPRNWRPHLLLFVGDVSKRINLVRLVSWFNQKRGVVTVCQMILGDLTTEEPDVRSRQQAMDCALEKAGLVAFSEVDVVSTFESGAIQITQANGIAGLQSNTIVFGWSSKRERIASQLRIMRAVAHVGKSTIIARIDPSFDVEKAKRIDVWWRGKERNGDLMLLLAYLLTLNPGWQGTRILVRSIASSEKERESLAQSLNTLLPEVRIEAQIDVILKPRDKSVIEIMHERSLDAQVVFLGLANSEVGQEEAYAARLEKLVNGFSTTVLVRNAHKFAGALI